MRTNSQCPGGHCCIKGAHSDRGTMATIGRAAAVADLRGIHLSGLTAWLLWSFIHFMHRVGFRNRLLVFVQWIWNYCTFRWGCGSSSDMTSGNARHVLECLPRKL